MPVQYTNETGGTPKKLIPAPMVNIGKEFYKTSGGKIIGSTHSITLTGVLLTFRGSPRVTYNSGTSTYSVSWNPDVDDVQDHTTGNRSLAIILRKQEALMELFGFTGKLDPDASAADRNMRGDGGLLEIQPRDGSTPLKFAVKVMDMQFEGGDSTSPAWTQLCKYTITLEARSLYGPDGTSPNPYDEFKWNVIEANESWDIAEDESLRSLHISNALAGVDVDNPDALLVAINESLFSSVNKVYSVTHTVSAVGTDKFDISTPTNLATSGEAWQQARGFVEEILEYESGGNSRLTPMINYRIPQLQADEVLDIPDLNTAGAVAYKGYNHARTQKVDETGGSFEVSETFLLSSVAPSGKEEVDCSVVTSRDDNKTKVTINGTITGYNTAGPQESGVNSFKNASGIWTTMNNPTILRAMAITLSQTEAELNVIPANKTVGSNPAAGIITYSVDFDDNPPTCFGGALSESVTITDTTPGHLFSTTPTIGRIRGPVMQFLGAADTAYTRGLSLEVVFEQGTGVRCSASGLFDAMSASGHPRNTHKTRIKEYIQAADPSNEPGINLEKCFFSSPEETWDFINQRYTLNIKWTYEKAAGNYPEMFADVLSASAFNS